MNDPTIIGQAANFKIAAREATLASHSGAVLLKDFCDRLGVAEILEAEVAVKERERGFSDSAALLGLTWNLLLGGDSLFDLNVLRGDPGTLTLLGLETVLAPTTAGEHLRKFEIGDQCDLKRAVRLIAERVRPQQRSKTCTIDLDSSVYEQCSTRKEGSCRAYNGEIGYHPLLAFWAEEGELLLTHLLAGKRHPAGKAVWFLSEVLKVAPLDLPLKLRADSAFYSWEFIGELEGQEITYAITADLSAQLKQQIEALPETAGRKFGRAGQVAEVWYAPGRHSVHRYVVKRVWLTNKTGAGDYRYHAVITNDETKSPKKLMKWALHRCQMENLIKEHKTGFGLEKLPTQKFQANQVWLLVGQLAYNLVAWFKKLILPAQYQRATIKTLRHQILNLAGKIVESGRQFFLILSDQYQYQGVWRHALKQLAKLVT